MSTNTTHRVKCTACGFRYRLQPEQLGKRLRCKECKELFVAFDSDAVPTAPIKSPAIVPVEQDDDDLLFDIPPEPDLRTMSAGSPVDHRAALLRSTPAIARVAAAGKKRAIPVWIGTNRVEGYCVLAAVAMFVVGLIFGGPVGLFSSFIILLVAIVELCMGIWLLVRVAGRNP